MTRRNGFTLSTPRPRTELLASIKAERFASPPMPPSDAPASPAPADTAPKAGEVPDTVDTQVTQQILDLACSDFRFCIDHRDYAAKADLRRCQPLPTAFGRLHDGNRPA